MNEIDEIKCKWCGEPLSARNHNLLWETWNAIRYFGAIIGIAVFLFALAITVFPPCFVVVVGFFKLIN